MRLDLLKQVQAMWASLPEEQCFLNCYHRKAGPLNEKKCSDGCILGWAGQLGLAGLSVNTHYWIPGYGGQQLGFDAASAAFDIPLNDVENLFSIRGGSRYDVGLRDTDISDKEIGLHRLQRFFDEVDVPSAKQRLLKVQELEQREHCAMFN